jgi:transcriptional regulator with PAS, ATPase and Fis domain
MAYDPRLMVVAVDSKGIRSKPGLTRAVFGLGHARPILRIACDRRASSLLDELGIPHGRMIHAPIKPAELLSAVYNLIEQSSETESSMRTNLVGESGPFRQVLQLAQHISRSQLDVLITGETGTGKGVLAQYIHRVGPRRDGPFVHVPCGAMPDELMENEMYGHEPGAYTGAGGHYAGKVAEAHGGTLFLDEIDSLSHASQTKLLHLLQERTFRPLGSEREECADVRVIAATNVDLSEEVRLRRFRSDLYYRISGATIPIPPLRDRPDDIPLLALHFLHIFAAKSGKPLTMISQTVLSRLLEYDWRGNVRELEHALERAVLFSPDESEILTEIDLPRGKSACRPVMNDRDSALKRMDEIFIGNALELSHGNISQAARAIGVNRKTLWILLKKHHIDPDRFRMH